MPSIKKILQNRFRLVFVDEMQDMDTHQYRLLDNLFYKKCIKNHTFQRIGDKNQAIFSGTAKVVEVWKDREKVMNLTGSYRLSPQIADVVKFFGLKYIDIKGRNVDMGIQPVMFLFNDNSRGQVLSKFTELIHQLKQDGILPQNLKHGVKAVGWSSNNDDADKLGINDYYQSFSISNPSQKIDYPNLKSYLLGYDKSKASLEPIRKNILNAFLRILRMEGLHYEERPFTKRKLLNYMKDSFASEYDDLNLNIFNWSMSLIRGQFENLKNECAAYFRYLLEKLFDKRNLSDRVNSFLDDNELLIMTANPETVFNRFIGNGIEVDIGSVHSVKGETHSATLYLETCYYHHESEKSKEQLLGKQLRSNSGKRTKESAKMMYVGLSRPTTLVCFAGHVDRINNEMRNEMRNNGWHIEIVT